MKIIGKIKRILGMFLKVSAILSLAILFILRPHLIFPFLKMIAVAGAFIWFLKFIEYDPNKAVEPLFVMKKMRKKVSRNIFGALNQ